MSTTREELEAAAKAAEAFLTPHELAERTRQAQDLERAIQRMKHSRDALEQEVRAQARRDALEEAAGTVYKLLEATPLKNHDSAIRRRAMSDAAFAIRQRAEEVKP